MYYEEKMINGRWFFRTSPLDEFEPMDILMLSKKYDEIKKSEIDLRETLNNAISKIDEELSIMGFMKSKNDLTQYGFGFKDALDKVLCKYLMR